MSLVRRSVLPALGSDADTVPGFGTGRIPGRTSPPLGRVGAARLPFCSTRSLLGCGFGGRLGVYSVPFEAGDHASCAGAHPFPFPQNTAWRYSAGKTVPVWEASTGNRVVEVSPSPAKSDLNQKEPS